MKPEERNSILELLTASMEFFAQYGCVSVEIDLPCNCGAHDCNGKTRFSRHFPKSEAKRAS